MNPYKILLVEDDAEISEMLKNYLETEQYEVGCALDGQRACAMFDAASYDLVLLDLMIPKVSGMGVMHHIREHSFVPIIILSAKDSESDKTLGLGLGADDYITKPFSVVEVLARIKAALRRTMQYDGAGDGDDRDGRDVREQYAECCRGVGRSHVIYGLYGRDDRRLSCGRL